MRTAQRDLLQTYRDDFAKYSGRLPYPPTHEEEGPLLETLLFTKLRGYLAYSRLRYRLHYWRSYDGVEVDVLCETRHGFVAVEIKGSDRWERRCQRGLERMRAELAPATVQCYGVYRGERPATWNDVQVLPVMHFLRRLWEGNILG